MYSFRRYCYGNITWLFSRSDFFQDEFDNDRQLINDFYNSLLSFRSLDKRYSRKVLEKHITAQLLNLGFEDQTISRYMISRGSMILKTLAANFVDIDRALVKNAFNDFKSTVIMAPIIEIGFIVLLDFQRSMKIAPKNNIIVTGTMHTSNLIKCFELLHRRNLIKISFRKNVSTYEVKDGDIHFNYPNITFGDLNKFLAASTDI